MRSVGRCAGALSVLDWRTVLSIAMDLEDRVYVPIYVPFCLGGSSSIKALF